MKSHGYISKTSEVREKKTRWAGGVAINTSAPPASDENQNLLGGKYYESSKQ